MTFGKTALFGTVAGVLMFVLAGRTPAQPAGKDSKVESSKKVPPSQDLRLRGRVVCLAEEMHRLYQTHLPTPHEHIYGFKTNEGVFYTLLRTKTSEALFADKRLREREIILQGRVLPNSYVLDATPVGSVHNGKIYDLYYYCDICSIKTVVPGECMCCREQVEFVEKPLDQ